MSAGFDLDRYLTEGVESIVKDALAASLKNPKETAFLLSYALASKRAASAREKFAAEGKHIPSFLIASITNRCNLHCAGCYARANSLCDDAETAALLTDEDWCRIFAEATQIGVSFCLLAGGEPMLRRGVLECAAKRREILFPVFTNGTLLSENMLELIDKNRNLVPIVSIEGDERQTDARRGAGTYQKLTANMERMREKGILFGASVTLTTENIQTVTGDAFLSMLRALGAKVSFFVDYVPADAGTESLAPGDAERDFLARRLDELRKQPDSMIYVSFPGDEQFSDGCLAAGRGFFPHQPHRRRGTLPVFAGFGHQPEAHLAACCARFPAVFAPARQRASKRASHRCLRALWQGRGARRHVRSITLLPKTNTKRRIYR